jgi:protein gp37/ParB-like chromosome segregation protein Spo0J
MDMLKAHPLADCLPDMPEDQFESFKEDISGLGVLEPITILDGMILDGRHRYRACLELGIECPMRHVDNVSPHDLVRSLNLHRRHLDASQRSMVGQALLKPFEDEAKKRQIEHAGTAPGKPKTLEENLPQVLPRRASEEVAKIVNVSPRLVKDAKVVADEGTPEERKAVINGKAAVTTTAKQVRSRRPQVQAIKPKPKSQPQKPKPMTFNETNENIGWAAYSWNPVTGCKHGCPYCYAAAMSKRYGWTFEPTFHEDRLGKTATKLKPENNNRVFVCSMGELFGPWVPDRWIEEVFDTVQQNPEWLFLFLTKSPERLPEVSWPINSRIGATIDRQMRVEKLVEPFTSLASKYPQNKRFISCEPLLEPIIFPEDLWAVLDWLIIGAKSEGQVKIQPNMEWVESLFFQARKHSVPVWFKDNLEFRPQEDCQ